MNRREFIPLLGATAVTWPLAARAQQPAKLPTIGFLGSSTASAMSQWVAAFVQRLRDLGWIDTVAIEYCWAEGRSSRADEIAAEFVRLKVDVLTGPGRKAGDVGYPDRLCGSDRRSLASRKGPPAMPETNSAQSFLVRSTPVTGISSGAPATQGESQPKKVALTDDDSAP